MESAGCGHDRLGDKDMKCNICSHTSGGEISMVYCFAVKEACRFFFKKNITVALLSAFPTHETYITDALSNFIIMLLYYLLQYKVMQTVAAMM